MEQRSESMRPYCFEAHQKRLRETTNERHTTAATHQLHVAATRWHGMACDCHGIPSPCDATCCHVLHILFRMFLPTECCECIEIIEIGDRLFEIDGGTELLQSESLTQGEEKMVLHEASSTAHHITTSHHTTSYHIKSYHIMSHDRHSNSCSADHYLAHEFEWACNFRCEHAMTHESTTSRAPIPAHTFSLSF